MRQIKSSAGRQSRAAIPKTYQDYQIYLQISTLEMEKSRRAAERAAAQARIAAIDSRLAEMEQEKLTLLSRLASGLTAEVAAKTASSPGFRIEY
jgi:hypothetical protein